MQGSRAGKSLARRAEGAAWLADRLTESSWGVGGCDLSVSKSPQKDHILTYNGKRSAFESLGHKFPTFDNIF